jgi:cytochrome b pre-mRNA-processing protein 3
MLKRFFGGPDVANPRSDSVYAGIVALARQPWLYSRAGVPDTVSGRFDMIVLHLALVMERLRDGGPAMQAFSQALLETMFADMDRNLREMGVGDLSVAKRMHTMAGVYYGRALAYREAFAGTDPPVAVAQVLARNLFPVGTPPSADVRLVADHAMALRTALAALPVAALSEGALPDLAPGEDRR